MRERASISAYFAVMGLVCAAMFSSIPDLKTMLGLDDARLGRLLLSGPVGTLASYTFVGILVTRLGSRRATILGACCDVAALAAIAAGFAICAPYAYWCAVLATMGAAGNLLNTSANTQAGLAQIKAGRSIMSGFHAIWSATNLSGLLFALAGSHFSLPVHWRVATLAAAALFCAAAGRRGLLASDARSGEKSAAGWCWPGFGLIGLGFMAMAFMGCEGSIYDWAGVFYKDVLAAPPQRVLWGICAVMLMVTAGRFVTDSLVNRFSETKIVHAYSLLLFSGLVFALCAQYMGFAGLSLHIAATAGYAVAGFGISALVPIVYGRTAKTTRIHPGAAVTIVTSLGFFGFFACPAVIGTVSSHFGLTAALALFALLSLAGLFMRTERQTGRQEAAKAQA